MINSPPHSSRTVATIPLIDYAGQLLLACLFVALLWLQWRFPLRRRHFSVLHRLVRNFFVSISGFSIVRLAMLPIPMSGAIWAPDRPIGLLNWVSLPRWAPDACACLFMDYDLLWWC